MQGTPEEYLTIYFRNHEYYLDYYKSYREGRKGQFNIAAFFVTGYWLVYRKMYFYAVLYLFGWFVIQSLLLAFLSLMAVTNYDSLIAWEIIVAVGMNIACGFLGNRVYMDKALREVRKILQKYPQEADRTRKLRKLGGTSFWFAVVLLVQILILDLTN